MPEFSKWIPSPRFPHQYPVCKSPLPPQVLHALPICLFEGPKIWAEKTVTTTRKKQNPEQGTWLDIRIHSGMRHEFRLLTRPDITTRVSQCRADLKAVTRIVKKWKHCCHQQIRSHVISIPRAIQSSVFTTAGSYNYKCLVLLPRLVSYNYWKNTDLGWRLSSSEMLSCVNSQIWRVVISLPSRKLFGNYARSQAFAAVELNSSVFWVIRRHTVVWNRRFGTTYQPHLQGSSCPKRKPRTLSKGTSV
jgi:hypothetical protein